MVDLSIVIVNYNAKTYLELCLQSIYKTINGINYEVFVVDNNSSESIEDMMNKNFPDVNLSLNTSNEGFAKANNKAIKKCSGHYILLLNNDTVLLPGAVNVLYSHMEKSLDIGILGPQILTKKKILQESFFKTPDLLTEFIQKTFYNKIIENKESFFGKRRYLKYQKEHEVDWITGACMMIRKEAIVDVDLFDDNFFMYFEDADLCCKVRKKGWKVIYTPLAKITHFGGMSRATNERKAAKEYRASQLYFYRKHHNKFTFILLKIFLLLKYLYKANSSILFFFVRKKCITDLKENLSDIGNTFSFILKYKYF
tara:strand:+ start:534 stop:1469 length:936 start_codon:yes stop_codon:yes gene_type:complete